MLGNDIVDLQKAAIESNWKRKGYLNKIFTPKEQIAIHNATNPNTMVWLFWSMKEAVYKIINRQTLVRFYSPQKFECKTVVITNCTVEGLVLYNGITYFTKSDLNQNFIYSIASTEITYLEKINSHYLPNTKNYIPLLKQGLGIHIQKNLFGVPEFIDLNLKTKKSISISHHGSYLAIAY